MASEGGVAWLAGLATQLISGRPPPPQIAVAATSWLDVGSWSPTKRAAALSTGAVLAYILWPTLDNFLRSVASVVTGSDLARTPPKPARPGTRYTTGLLNRGNDCYINATLQALAGLPPLGEPKGIVSEALAAVLAELAEPISVPRTASARPVVRALEVSCRAHFSSAQQDAHEFLHLLLERLESELGTLPFRGQLADAIVCTRCHFTSTRTTNFLVHTVAVPNASHARLTDLLGPQVEAVEGFRCESCNHVVSVRKTTVVDVAPEILCVHLSRSLFSYASGSRRNACSVDIPEQLIVSGTTYKLMSSVSHAGTHMSGHYDASRRSAAKYKPWWTISDQRVRQATTSQVCGEQPRSYLLFYQKISSPILSEQPVQES